MKVGLAIFAYNRSWHLGQVLNGLKENEQVDEVYIFQDGLKREEHREEWEKTRKIIEDFNWCKPIKIYSECNKGLAKSIVEGINYALEENDAIIVLEDDCVPAPNFITFMKTCFEIYENEKKIYCITGYSYPFDITSEEYLLYFTGRISSWGWGTWKSRWQEFSMNYEVLSQIKKDREKEHYLSVWGRDLEQMLVARLIGNNDSWAVFWALHVIENKGYAINPYKNLIHNIEFDGTGVHCVTGSHMERKIQSDCEEWEKSYPREICILEEVEKEAVKQFGYYTALDKFYGNKECIIVYGNGQWYKENERKIVEKYHVLCFVNSKEEGWFCGKPIIMPCDIQKYEEIPILLMIRNEVERNQIKKKLIEDYGIQNNRIQSYENLFD